MWYHMRYRDFSQARRSLLNAMSPADLAAEGRLFGQVPLPKWQIVQAAYEHGIWTLGATVPYVRMQGGTPHSYGIVPRT
jgi:hypothetical protein